MLIRVTSHATPRVFDSSCTPFATRISTCPGQRGKASRRIAGSAIIASQLYRSLHTIPETDSIPIRHVIVVFRPELDFCDGLRNIFVTANDFRNLTT